MQSLMRPETSDLIVLIVCIVGLLIAKYRLPSLGENKS